MKKLPPLEKIYEAYSAIADGRVTPGESEALVRSSDGAKEYRVTWDGDVYEAMKQKEIDFVAADEEARQVLHALEELPILCKRGKKVQR